MSMLVAAPLQKPQLMDFQKLSANVDGARKDVINAANQEVNGVRAKLIPASLLNLAGTSVRAFKDVNDTLKAQQNIALILTASGVADKSDSRAGQMPDIGPERALTIVTELKMHNSLAALTAVIPNLPSELHQWTTDIVNDSRQQFSNALRTREGDPEVSPLTRNIALSAPVNRTEVPQSDSMNAFFGELSEAIASLKTDYLGVYETAMEKNSAFYKEFLNATDLTKWMVASDKEVTLTLQDGAALADLTEVQISATVMMRTGVDKHWVAGQFGMGMWVNDSPETIRANVLSEHKALQLAQGGGGLGLLGGLKALLQKLEPASNSVKVLVTDENGNPVVNETFAPLTNDQRNGILVFAKDEASAKKWAKDMGLPESVVSQNPQSNPKEGEQWLVKLDLKPVKNMIKSLEKIIKKEVATPDANGMLKVSLKTAHFQAWKVGFEAQATEIKNTSTVLAQKMANAQSIYENLIKVLSNTINAIMEMLKAFLQN
jgi:hypothetical protein